MGGELHCITIEKERTVINNTMLKRHFITTNANLFTSNFASLPAWASMVNHVSHELKQNIFRVTQMAHRVRQRASTCVSHSTFLNTLDHYRQFQSTESPRHGLSVHLPPHVKEGQVRREKGPATESTSPFITS